MSGLLRVNRKVAIVAGQELTNTELEVGMKEISQMFKSYSPENPQGFRTDVEPSNASSAVFKEYLEGIASDEKELAQTMASINLDALLGENLASNTGRREAKSANEKIVMAVRKCLDSELGRLTKFSDSFTRPKLSETVLGATRARLTDARNLFEEVTERRLKIIEFTERTKPSFEDGQLRFFRDRDVTAFNDMVEAYNAKLQELEAKQNSHLAIQKSSVSKLTDLFAPESP